MKGMAMIGKLAKFIREYVDSQRNPRIRQAIMEVQGEMRKSMELMDMFVDEGSESEGEGEGLEGQQEEDELREISQQFDEKKAEENRYMESEAERRKRVTEKFKRLAQRQQANDNTRLMHEHSSTKNLLEAAAKRIESYHNSSSLEWIYAYLQVATAENSALEKKVLELEHTVQR